MGKETLLLFYSLTYPLHLFNIFRPQQWLGKVNSALCKWRKSLKRGSALRAQVFFTLSFSMVSIPIEGKELTLVSERSLKTHTKSWEEFMWTQSCSCNPTICATYKKCWKETQTYFFYFLCCCLWCKSLTCELGHGSRHKMPIHLSAPNPHSCEDTWRRETEDEGLFILYIRNPTESYYFIQTFV